MKKKTNAKFLVNIAAGFWEKNIPGWNEKTLQMQKLHKMDVLREINNFLNGDSFTSMYVYDGQVDIKIIEPALRVTVIRSAGYAFKK